MIIIDPDGNFHDCRRFFSLFILGRAFIFYLPTFFLVFLLGFLFSMKTSNSGRARATVRVQESKITHRTTKTTIHGKQ